MSRMIIVALFTNEDGHSHTESRCRKVECRLRTRNTSEVLTRAQHDALHRGMSISDYELPL